MANKFPEDTSTIYVEIESENGGIGFMGVTHFGSPDVLDDGVYLAQQFGETGLAIVDAARADDFVSMFNHTPGCHVTECQ